MLNIYVGSGEDLENGALLVFASNAREAKRIFWNEGRGMVVETFFDARVKRLRDRDWLYKEANQAFLLGDRPHVIDNPRSCNRCEQWGHYEILSSGMCQDCEADFLGADHA